jgi:hypothetical protein
MVHVVAVVIGISAFGLSSCLRCLFFVHCFAYVFWFPTYCATLRCVFYITDKLINIYWQCGSCVFSCL